MPVKKESSAPTGWPVRGSRIPFGAGATRVMGLSIPFQRPLPPLIYEANGQNAKEHHHRPEAVETDLAKHNRPREQEADLEVENDEKNGDEIKPHIEFHARVIKSVESALISRKLFRIRLLVCDDEGGDQERQTDAQRDRYENYEGQVVHQQCAHRRPQACSPALLDCTPVRTHAAARTAPVYPAQTGLVCWNSLKNGSERGLAQHIWGGKPTLDGIHERSASMSASIDRATSRPR